VHTEAFEDISITLCINDTRNKLLLKQGLPWKFMLMGQRPLDRVLLRHLEALQITPRTHFLLIFGVNV
jgi:hypothetical protein